MPTDTNYIASGAIEKQQELRDSFVYKDDSSLIQAHEIRASGLQILEYQHKPTSALTHITSQVSTRYRFEADQKTNSNPCTNRESPEKFKGHINHPPQAPLPRTMCTKNMKLSSYRVRYCSRIIPKSNRVHTAYREFTCCLLICLAFAARETFAALARIFARRASASAASSSSLVFSSK